MTNNVATDFPDPGMLEHLRELAAAEPFTPFTIRLLSGAKLRVEKASHIQFTPFGAPKVYAKTTDKNGIEERSGWHILNVDAIAELLLSTTHG